MLKKHSQVFQSILFLIEMALISLVWVSAYFLRFYTRLVPVSKGVPSLEESLGLLLFLLPIHTVVFRYFGLYDPMRSKSRMVELRKILTASILSVLIFITAIYLIKEYKYSRIVFVYFFVLSSLVLVLFRYSIRLFLGWMRKQGYNLRHILIAGDGNLGQELERKLSEHAEYGFKVIGFLTKDEERVGKKINNIPILGVYRDIKAILRQTNADQLLLALPFEHIRMIKSILGHVYDEMVEIKIVPDLYQYFTMRQGIEDLDGMPIIGLRESPLYGWNKLLKRGFDIVASLLVLFFVSPLLFVIAVMIKATSKGPVFYKQRRMGLDGKPFKIVKFRSMLAGAEKHTGPVWAKADDSRKTPLGAFLRKYNLDELPQFYNVLKGQMSIVGPRPERPEFMEEFKKKIPEYMLRHKMKAGITGWAQVNGLRGNTSIEERTKYDLYYIENWSFGFDLIIFFKTVIPFLKPKNAY